MLLLKLGEEILEIPREMLYTYRLVLNYYEPVDPINLIFKGDLRNRYLLYKIVNHLQKRGWRKLSPVQLKAQNQFLIINRKPKPQDVQMIFNEKSTRFHVRLWNIRPTMVIGNAHHEQLDLLHFSYSNIDHNKGRKKILSDFSGLAYAQVYESVPVKDKSAECVHILDKKESKTLVGVIKLIW